MNDTIILLAVATLAFLGGAHYGLHRPSAREKQAFQAGYKVGFISASLEAAEKGEECHQSSAGNSSG